MALLSEEKTSHLSHMILHCLKRTPAARLARLKGDETQALRAVKRVLASELAEEEQLDRLVRAKLESYSRRIVEGSPEWEVLYRKTFEEEARKRMR